MDKETAHTLAQRLSYDRFDTYLARTGDEISAMRLYAWNIEMSAALWGPLVAVEILVRNAFHDRLTEMFGQDDWWSSPDVSLDDHGEAQIRQAIDRSVRNHKGTSPGDVVAELSFGFWVGLVGKGEDYENRLWRRGLSTALPNYKGGRRGLHTRLHHLRKLRNRIAHHEPVFGRDLDADYVNVLKTLEDGCTTTRDWVVDASRVLTVLARRDATVSGSRRGWF